MAAVTTASSAINALVMASSAILAEVTASSASSAVTIPPSLIVMVPEEAAKLSELNWAIPLAEVDASVRFSFDWAIAALELTSALTITPEAKEVTPALVIAMSPLTATGL